MMLRPATPEQEKAIASAVEHLRQARDLLIYGECPASVVAVRRAMKSAEGAYRHSWRRAELWRKQNGL